MLNDILSQVHKPAQYIGSEWNVSKKDFASSGIRVALGFADLYEVGMSNLGLRIIYGLLNEIPDTCCERFFYPEADMQAILKEKGMPLFSLESQRGLNEFDIIGFSLGSELNYSNVLGILELSGLPLESSSRSHDYPLVIGGGPCCLNPEPMHEFFDLFLIGEAEEAVVEFLNSYRRFKEDFKSGRMPKEELLKELSGIEGIYAPSLYDPVYSAQGEFLELKPRFKCLPQRIKKRIIRDLDSAYFPRNWPVPYIQIIHDRFSVELMRGCPNHCRFCQARSQYFPFRIREKGKILELALSIYKCSGYEELSLAGLSVSDYPQLEELVSRLNAAFNGQEVGISLPSIKAKSIIGNISGLIAKTKKTGLTFAPEAGTKKMRQALAKDFSEEEFFQAISEAYASGYQHLKLYFLIGLPNESKEDLDGIIDFANAASGLKKKIAGPAAQINISINGLIPKPHTPLQWLAMENMESLKEKEDYLRQRNRNKRLKLSFHNRQMGFLEGILSRGDRRLSRVIRRAYLNGANSDAWSSCFSLEKWLSAFTAEGVNPEDYLKKISVDSALPWDFIDTGIDKKYLIEEFNKSIAI